MPITLHTYILESTCRSHITVYIILKENNTAFQVHVYPNAPSWASSIPNPPPPCSSLFSSPCHPYTSPPSLFPTHYYLPLFLSSTSSLTSLPYLLPSIPVHTPPHSYLCHYHPTSAYHLPHAIPNPLLTCPGHPIPYMVKNCLFWVHKNQLVYPLGGNEIQLSFTMQLPYMCQQQICSSNVTCPNCLTYLRG